ncbi:MAG: siderophore-interacting protein [Pseudomonadota bacterium]
MVKTTEQRRSREAPPRTRPKPRILEVARTEQLSPNMLRVVLTGDELSGWPPGSDGANIKIGIPDPGWSSDDLRARMEQGPRPVIRTYTARRFDVDRNELAVDFVLHGDVGIAASWASRARRGAPLAVAGPSGLKLPTRDADWYLVYADMSAMPAAEAALESLPPTTRGHVIFDVLSAADRRAIAVPENMTLTWLINTHPETPSTEQLDCVKSLSWPDGRASVFVAGEAGVVRKFRTWLLDEKNVAKADAYISGYWKVGLVEEQYQADKRAS